MKGSDKWGQGSGPRLEVVVAILVAISLLGVAFYYVESSGLTSSGQATGVSTVSTTGIPCASDSMPQSAQTAERDPSFAGLSNGRCYNFLGSNGSTLTFAHYNGTIAYPCGTSPVQLPDSEIQVVISPRGGVVSSQLVAPSGPFEPGPCDRSLPLKVVGVDDVESTIPAVPQLNLTLASAGGGLPVTALRAVLTLDGGSQSFQFRSVSSNSPLAPGGSISLTEIVLSGVSFNASEVYPMTISGSLDSGQNFSFVVHVQIAHAP